jgi:hypothetical protein
MSVQRLVREETMEYKVIEAMIGKVMSNVEVHSSAVDRREDELVFTAKDGTVFTFYHAQDCCESVSIEDVCGDLRDLIGSPLIVAEEASNREGGRGGSETWTFYRFATSKGNVTVRWYGESNGYYSESVDMSIAEPHPEESVIL